MNRRTQFQIGLGVFKCTGCGRRTRGNGESAGLELCAECAELAGSDNYYNDTGTVPSAEQLAVHNALLAVIGERGGDIERVKGSCGYIWTK